MKHLSEYFINFRDDNLENIFNSLYRDGWDISGEDKLIDDNEVKWNYGDIQRLVTFSRDVFNVIVISYKMFLTFQEKLMSVSKEIESNNSEVKICESVVSKPQTLIKEFIPIKRRKYIKLE